MGMNMNNQNWKRKALVLMAFVVGCAFVVPSYAQKVHLKPPEKKTTVTEPVVNVNTGAKKDQKKDTKKIQKKEPVAKPHPTVVHTAHWAVEQLKKNMVRIEGGSFMMGIVTDGDDENMADNTPAHKVTLSPFLIGKYEVTEEEWRLIMGEDPSDDANGKYTASSCPVDNVSWDDCQVFIEKLRKLTGLPYRLPTEAEWEYAAKGGNGEWPYAGSADIKECGWYSSNSENVKHPVGKKRPNGFGLYDMTGNVREWCGDFYDEKFYSESSAENPIGPAEGTKRVIRGGGFNSRDENSCQVTYRASHFPDGKNKNLGLRLACSIE